MTLQEKTVEKLIENNYHIAFAESCTGGMCCAALVDVANASRVLDMSFVTYANEAKIKLLGVDENTINTHGVVSEQVAREMACGVCKTADCEIGVGVSGIAGPTGGTQSRSVWSALDFASTATPFHIQNILAISAEIMFAPGQ